MRSRRKGLQRRTMEEQLLLPNFQTSDASVTQSKLTLKSSSSGTAAARSRGGISRSAVTGSEWPSQEELGRMTFAEYKALIEMLHPDI
jgi:hypothetical protein